MAEITVSTIMTTLTDIISALVEIIVSTASTILANPYFFWCALVGLGISLVGFVLAKFNAN